MHVPATNGFLLHLIKVTCWEEPNHDCKQRIRSIVKTSQVSSIDHLRDSALHLAKGKGFRVSRPVKSISFPAVGLWVQRCPNPTLSSLSYRIVDLSREKRQQPATSPATTRPWNAELRCDSAEIPKAKEMMRKHAAILRISSPTLEMSWLCGDVTHFAIYTWDFGR